MGLARQVVYRLMVRIRARLQALPADWIKVETWLPPAEARQVIELAAQLLANYQSLEKRSCQQPLTRIDMYLVGHDLYID